MEQLREQPSTRQGKPRRGTTGDRGESGVFAPTRSPVDVRQGQRGMVLLVALVVLVALTLAGIGMMRTVDTAGVIAGNLAFKGAALQIADVGVGTATTDLATYAAAPDAKSPSGCTNNCNYFPAVQTTDSKGVPSTVSWSAVASTTPLTGYTVQYVIDRLCNTSPATDLGAQCLVHYKNMAGSHKVGSPVFATIDRVNFRVTVRVAGPRSTETFIQTIVSR